MMNNNNNSSSNQGARDVLAIHKTKEFTRAVNTTSNLVSKKTHEMMSWQNSRWSPFYLPAQLHGNETVSDAPRR